MVVKFENNVTSVSLCAILTVSLESPGQRGAGRLPVSGKKPAEPQSSDGSAAWS